MESEYFTVKEIAARLKVHPQTIKDWLRSGEMKGVNFGGRTGWRVTDAQLQEFIEKRSESKIAA